MQPDIDKITTSIVNRNNVHSYNQYMESIGYVANFYKEIYGENSNALNYIDNKNKELKQRLGNKLLKELKSRLRQKGITKLLKIYIVTVKMILLIIG